MLTTFLTPTLTLALILTPTFTLTPPSPSPLTLALFRLKPEKVQVKEPPEEQPRRRQAFRLVYDADEHGLPPNAPEGGFALYRGRRFEQAVAVAIALDIVLLCLWTSPTIPTLNETDQAGINVYDGQWSNHQRCGRGLETVLHGERYDGGWLNNAKHGVGQVRYLNGKLRDGRWRSGKHEKWLGKERLMKRLR